MCHITPRRRDAATCVGLRDAATWPCVPRRIHVGPAQKYPIFCLILIILNDLNRK